MRRLLKKKTWTKKELYKNSQKFFEVVKETQKDDLIMAKVKI